MEQRNIWVIGGDLRQEKLAQLLHLDGHSVHTFALEKSALPPAVARHRTLEEACRAECVILPLPVMGEEGYLNAPMSAAPCPLGEVFAALRPGQMICGGMVTERVAGLAAGYGLVLRDYFAREELAVANAVPTG